jgi:putative acetyltransferase
VEVRDYTAGDDRATLLVFLRAVRETAIAHYSPEQIEAWAADSGDLKSWAAARAAAHTFLAIIEDQVAGFTDVDDSGYIDMLFVHPNFGRHGVASALLAHVVAFGRQRGLPALTTFASLTSEPVFERQGFVTTGQRYFGEGDSAAKTYAMRCALDNTTAP